MQKDRVFLIRQSRDTEVTYITKARITEIPSVQPKNDLPKTFCDI